MTLLEYYTIWKYLKIRFLSIQNNSKHLNLNKLILWKYKIGSEHPFCSHYIMNSNCTNTLTKYNSKVPMGMCLYNIFTIAYTQYQLLPWTVIIVIIRVTYTYNVNIGCRMTIFFFITVQKFNCTHTIISINIPTTRDRRTLCVRFTSVHMNELNLMVAKNIILY